ncbi:uncharacterized protein EDB91DRAFT_2323 [Suillus paluster]|uniref:uncharacterized protein n=1 Tax=Suillus paluster TaxID=48578 RepID=UPI001B8675F4|nr:uncharacterized protein EDB91DRAFT_2323 [Suillus paluster]KAG1756239.1 hypothetical protein EDB91DRAFT_2323 [Suillus paluster]
MANYARFTPPYSRDNLRFLFLDMGPLCSSLNRPGTQPWAQTATSRSFWPYFEGQVQAEGHCHIQRSLGNDRGVACNGLRKYNLLMDYYGFDPYFYQQRFESKGDRGLAVRVLQLYKEVHHPPFLDSNVLHRVVHPNKIIIRFKKKEKKRRYIDRKSFSRLIST